MRRAACLVLFLAAVPAWCGTIHITRAGGPIRIDGDLSDPGWKNATRVDQWWETNPGDNVTPKAKSIAYLAYDDHFFYAGFEFDDPDPSKILGPYNDRDHIGSNTDDYGGVILDTRDDHKTAILFLVNPHNIQYDSVNDDTTGNEDSAPDFFWDSATKINGHGWTLEIRIPFSTLRYAGSSPEWGIMLYRNWPRDRRYQIFANRIPRGNNCFICNEDELTGLT
ncbi:MAG TPA: carbohydrate binding family 9 domain-containing protein, partial [Thermoanaerobaculia bacterium]|nr:carbohydrate binding family 9 domain-containing protein [Thermoanaerobaculia bacterium]